MKKTILIFGAGKIGRSFIGQVFGQSGYKIVFVDIDQQLVNLLNTRGAYRVVFVDSRHPEKEEEITVKDVSAIHISERDLLLKILTEADIAATSVGKRGLKALLPLLAEGIAARYGKEAPPLDIILAENHRDAAGEVRSACRKMIAEVPDAYVGLIETSIGKMVPIHRTEHLRADPLRFFAEPYNSLVVDAGGFRNAIPAAEGLEPRNNIRAWVDRKLFIHNMGHAALAYHAWALKPGLTYTWEAAEDEEIRELTKRTMHQSAQILKRMYSGVFEEGVLEAHIDDLLERFSNRKLGDTMYRVGSDLPRKLGSDDRLMVPVLNGLELAMDVDLIMLAWIRGCRFTALDEHGQPHPGDQKFREKFGGDPLRILTEHCTFDRRNHKRLFKIVKQLINK